MTGSDAARPKGDPEPAAGSTAGRQPGSSAAPADSGGAASAPTSSGRSAGNAQDSRAEQVLSQALRVMAGGGKPPPASVGTGSDQPPAAHRFSTGQFLLLAITVGLLIGIVGGLISLL
jgi:hypothetical protein